MHYSKALSFKIVLQKKENYNKCRYLFFDHVIAGYHNFYLWPRNQYPLHK